VTAGYLYYAGDVQLTPILSVAGAGVFLGDFVAFGREVGDLLVEFLTEAGYTVEACQQGADALTRLDTLHPDFLITDLVMDGMQGMEVLRMRHE